MTPLRSAAFLLAATALVALPGEAAAPPFDTPATVAFMKDLSSGAILYSKNADQRIPPASLAKMMTVYVAFDMIKKGQLHLND
ncbi:MAG: D-alanyl-D-alanine carboxypeptidase, partial [Sphingomonas sp.]|nr:D-alanyl-D-alanine carboxypeptidase [Sphingomonas sp.]